MTILRSVLCRCLFTILAFRSVRLPNQKYDVSRSGAMCARETRGGEGRTVNRFFDPPADGGPNVVFEGPGRDNRAFPPPTFLVPSFIALEEDVNGSGAATFESFCDSVRYGEG